MVCCSKFSRLVGNDSNIKMVFFSLVSRGSEKLLLQSELLYRQGFNVVMKHFLYKV